MVWASVSTMDFPFASSPERSISNDSEKRDTQQYQQTANVFDALNSYAAADDGMHAITTERDTHRRSIHWSSQYSHHSDYISSIEVDQSLLKKQLATAIPTESASNNNINGDYDDDIKENILQNYSMKSNASQVSLKDSFGAPSPLPFAISSDNLTFVEMNALSSEEKKEHQVFLPSHHVSDHIAMNTTETNNAGVGVSCEIIVPSTTHHYNSISKCEYVEGKPTYNDVESDSEHDDTNEGGIIILDPLTEEELVASEFEKDDKKHRENNVPQDSGIQITQYGIEDTSDNSRLKQSMHATSASLFDNDSIILAAANHVKQKLGQLSANNAEESHGFKHLLQEVDCEERQCSAESVVGDSSQDGQNATHVEDTSISRNIFSSQSKQPLNENNEQSTAPPSNPGLTHPPARATQLRYDKYIVEVDIFQLQSGHSQVHVRDVINVLANVDLLPLWFSPVPAIFDALITDGRGCDSNIPDEHNNIDTTRSYDGEWIEISTPLLSLPSDSRISGCIRSIRVATRSLIGFPARVRSMVFVERQRGRVGMTIGPFPDGLCNGTVAFHSFTVRVWDEESGVGNQRLVVSDEVRLQRGGDEALSGNRSCGYCLILRLLIRFIEWLFLRSYQPDLASFMSQTISSMEVLRLLIERGESAAYVGNELVVEISDWEGGGDTPDAPLLG